MTPLALGIVLVAAFTGLAIRIFALVMPIAMAFAVVATANHFVLDVVAGLIVVCVGLAVAIALERHRFPSNGSEPTTQNPNNRGLPPRLR